MRTVCRALCTKRMDRNSGFPPLDLQIKGDFSPFHMVTSRPVNPRLFEHMLRMNLIV